ncbi:MAG: SusD/RagB family nutrient-binding outer membrane lipoprotein [Ginsengibacter sp.]
MKKLNYLLIVLIATSGWQGCTKFKDSININPNQPTVASNAQLLTYAINQIPNVIEEQSGMLYTQQLAQKPYTDESRYISVNFDFYGIYAGALENLQTIISTKNFNVNDGSQANQLAVARILKAWFFWHATDRWGDIPYSDALKGITNFTPKYDSQKDIYYDLLKELKEAAAQIDNGNPVSGDILYSGDMDAWKKFANSMRVIMALRLSKVDPAKGKTELTDALTGPVISDNSESAVYVHLNTEAYENYWYYVRNVQGRPWYWASQTLVDYMKPLGDPRLPIFADPNGSGDYVGVPYGLDANAVGTIPSSSVSFMGVHVRTQNAPTYILTYAEVLLAIAEADKLGWLPGGDEDAKQKYYAAIEASVRQWNRTSFKAYNDNLNKQVEPVPYSKDDAGDITGLSTYLAQPSIVYNSADAIKQISYQRWVHLYMNGYEAWAEWRRTGYPVLAPAPNNNNIAIPRRQAYPTKEQNINPANYKAAVAAQPGLGGKDDLTGRVWWDKP